MVKRCPECQETKLLQDFYKNRSTQDKHSAYCKVCTKAKMSEYYANNKVDIQRRREPVRKTEKYKTEASARSSKWAKDNPSLHWNNTRSRRMAMVIRSFDSERIAVNEFYINRPEGHHVDHIVPLKHPLVCGLHVVANLQYLTSSDNDSKGNKFRDAVK